MMILAWIAIIITGLILLILVTAICVSCDIYEAEYKKFTKNLKPPVWE